MKIEEQVCSLEQAKRLKELGIVYNEAPFSWLVIMPDIEGKTYFNEVVYKHEIVTTLCESIAPAFTTAELGVMLNCESDGSPVNLNDDLFTFINHFQKEAINEADLRAKLLIKALEIGFFTPKEVNERLSA